MSAVWEALLERAVEGIRSLARHMNRALVTYGDLQMVSVKTGARLSLASTSDSIIRTIRNPRPDQPSELNAGQGSETQSSHIRPFSAHNLHRPQLVYLGANSQTQQHRFRLVVDSASLQRYALGLWQRFNKPQDAKSEESEKAIRKKKEREDGSAVPASDLTEMRGADRQKATVQSFTCALYGAFSTHSPVTPPFNEKHAEHKNRGTPELELALLRLPPMPGHASASMQSVARADLGEAGGPAEYPPSQPHSAILPVDRTPDAPKNISNEQASNMVTGHLSPRYAEQATPDGKHTTTVMRPLSAGMKVFKISKVLSYFFGSVLFQLGSIYFYPKYSILWNGKGGLFGSWAFVIGCVFFMLGTNMDFIDTIRNNSGSTTRQILNAYNGLMYVMAGVIFELGAIYFLPDWYAKAPSLGCWAFLLGSIQFCLAALGDIVFILITHEDPKQSGIKLSNLFCWGTLAALGTFVGAFLFILGSWFYLPRFIAQEDAVLSEAYMYKSINFYTIGSVFFIINSLAQIPDMLTSFKTGQPVVIAKDGVDHV